MEKLTTPSKDLKTVKRFPPSLRGTVYEAMLEAVSEELSVWRDAVREQKTSFYDVDKMSLERLSEISGTFGAPFITSVKNDEAFLREEARAIPFKIFYKGTATLYKSFFYAAGRFGEMFIYIYRADIKNIMRSMLDPFDEAFLTPPDKPFRHRSKGDFSGNIVDWLKLDSGLFLDAGDALWKLDTSAAAVSTNHIGFEYFVDRVIAKAGADGGGANSESEYLMTKEYLDYMGRSIEFARRAKEVPHIGSQLSIQTDASGLYNSHDTSLEHSVPSLKLKAAARRDFFNLVASARDITSVEFGIGRQEIAGAQTPDLPFPENLKSKVFTSPVLFYDRFEGGLFTGAVGEYRGQSLGGFQILDGGNFDGVKQEFKFALPYAPIQRGNVTLELRLPSGETLVVRDDRKGIFSSIHGKGGIDYRTGECYLSTKFDFPRQERMEPDIQSGGPDPTEGGRRFVKVLEGGSSVMPRSLWLTFTIGEGSARRTYMANDAPRGDGLTGEFSHDFIERGVVDYSAKTVDILFNTPLADMSEKPFFCSYSFPVNYALPKGTELLASYFFTHQPIFITEAGFRNKDGVLLNYATFPPFEFNSSAYHLSFTLLVRKPGAP